MAEFGSGPAPDQEPEDVATSIRNSRIGLVLFFIYTAAYATFIALNAFRPSLMEETPLAGLNVAILYGFGLIFGAFLMALLYGWLCRNPAKSHGRAEDVK